MDTTIAIKQHKFSNGMISKSLRGDTTHPKYGTSLKVCRNWIPIPQGALVKRPGFKFVAPVKDATYVPRLIKFVFSDDQTFVLEVGNLYLRFYQRGKYVGNDGALHTYGDAYGGGYYEIVTPFTTAMLPYLKFAQVGDVITLTYGGQAAGIAAIAPLDLRHTSGALSGWVINTTPLKIPAGAVTAGAPTIGIATYTFTGATTGIVWAQGQRAYWLSSVAPTVGAFIEWIAIQLAVKGSNQQPPDPFTLNSTSQSVSGNLYWMPAVDLAHPAVRTQWVQTAVVQDSEGVTFESAPSLVLEYNSSLAPDRQLPIGISQPTLAGGYTLLFHRLYRATAGGIFGWVNDILTSALVQYPGTTTPFGATLGFYIDDGRAPDYTRQPPQGTDPFLVNGVDSYPCVVNYLDQRRLFAAQAKLPSAIVLSRVGDLYNWDGTQKKLVPGADTDGMLIILASETLEQVRSFVPMRRGLILTGQGEWALAGQGGGPVSRSSLDVKRQSKWGSSWLNPIIIGTGLLFNTAKSNMVRDLYPLYGLYADIWDGQDLSVMARDLLDLHTLVDWDFQSTPYPVVWAVRDDGVLLSLTYQHAPPSFGQQLTEGIVAWAFHDTGAGSDAFEAVCVVPEPPDDAVYCITRRVINGATVRFIERSNSPIPPASPYLSGVPDVRYAGFLDAAFSYDGHADKLGFGANAATIDSVTVPGSTNPVNYGIGSLVKVTVGGAAPFAAADAAAPYGSAVVFDPEDLLQLAHATHLDGDGVTVLSYGAPQGKVVAFTTGSIVVIELAVPMSQAQVTAWRAGAVRWAIAKGQVTAASLTNYQLDSGDGNGLRGITCLADGDVQAPAVWAAGVASLITPAVVIQLGISYNSDAELLDLYLAATEIRNKFKSVTRLGFEVANTRDLWGGPSFDDLCELEERTVLDAYSIMGLHTGYYELFVKGSADKTGAAVVRHFQPLPATISSVTREVNLGGS